jgi:hypothetical protein
VGHDFAPLNNKGMPSIVATGKASDDISGLRKDIDDLAFSFIAPLGADDY